MDKLVNLTPHPIVILGDTPCTIPPSGTEARVVEYTCDNEEILEGVHLVTKHLDYIEGLPERTEEERYYIVSRIVALAAMRSDLLVPDDFVRDESGNILGCRRLASLS
jgi:hypothetical protein